jgi:hypothetical protein
MHIAEMTSKLATAEPKPVIVRVFQREPTSAAINRRQMKSLYFICPVALQIARVVRPSFSFVRVPIL